MSCTTLPDDTQKTSSESTQSAMTDGMCAAWVEVAHKMVVFHGPILQQYAQKGQDLTPCHIGKPIFTYPQS